MSLSAHQPRIAVSEDAVLSKDGADDIACTIIDVSSDGFRLSVPRAVPCGTDYRLSFGSEQHSVAVRWASLKEVGGQFLR